MKHYIAIDGCQSGWLAVSLSKDVKELRHDLIESGQLQTFIKDYKDSTPILIDMPIGLLEEGNTMRCCDRLARQFLGPRKTSSVFPVPARKALDKNTHDKGSELNRTLTGRGVPVQTWKLKDKLIEVDDLIKSDATMRETLLEFHPEVAFACLNNNEAVKEKKSRRDGKDNRIAILERQVPELNIRNYYQEHKEPGKFKEDDFLDALAGAVMLHVSKGKLMEMPDSEDCEGLQRETWQGVMMRILYIDPDT